MTDLLVLINGSLAGRTFADKHGNPGFAYDDNWRNSRDAIPLSLSLPLAASEHASETIAAVIWGFLPDNEHVLHRWARRFQVSPRNPLSLLANVGEDCAGAAQFVRPARLEDVLSYENGYHIDWLDDAQVAERLRAVRLDAGEARRQSDIGQFSLPGAQPKIALHFDNGKWGIPQGRTPTTHILKPPTGVYAGYAENEHLCLSLARRMGLTVCQSQVLRFEDELTICVTRYDRKPVEGRWWRVHQEDLCQSLGVMPQQKYQNEGGPSPIQISDTLRENSSEPRSDQTHFLLSLIYNWLIGGTDAHAKNYSLLIGNHLNVRLAPLYDISSALPYPQLDRRKLKMAMKIGSHYRWYEISLRDWVALGGAMGFTEPYIRTALRLFSSMIADEAATEAHEMKAAGITHLTIERLVDAIDKSAQRCLKMLDES